MLAPSSALAAGARLRCAAAGVPATANAPVTSDKAAAAPARLFAGRIANATLNLL